MIQKLKLDELNRISVDEFRKSEKKPVVFLLDNIRSLNNIGSVFRTADAFRIEKIFLCGITARPPHRDIHKTALGATESVDWKYFESPVEAVEELKNENFTIVALEQTNQSVQLNRFVPESGKKYAVILGNEINGVSDEILKLADIALEIPQFGTKHSFNVSVSAGIILWDILLKMNLL